MRRSRLLPFLLLLCASCVTDPLPWPQPTALLKAEARWREQRLSSYILVQSRSCFCPDAGAEYVVTVENLQITSVRSQLTGEVLPETRHAHFRTVDQLFIETHQAINRRGVLREVRFEPVFGYPTLLSLDPLLNAVDDETVFNTTLVFRRD